MSHLSAVLLRKFLRRRTPRIVMFAKLDMEAHRKARRRKDDDEPVGRGGRNIDDTLREPCCDETGPTHPSPGTWLG